MPASWIRLATLADLDALEDLENTVFSSDELSRRSLRYYISAPNACFLLLGIGSALVGDALVSFRSNSTIGRLYSIAIRPDRAGLGHGRQLLAACEEAVKQRGGTILRLEVRSDNSAAIHLYENAGYTRFGTYPDYYEDGTGAFRFQKSIESEVEATRARTRRQLSR